MIPQAKKNIANNLVERSSGGADSLLRAKASPDDQVGDEDSGETDDAEAEPTDEVKNGYGVLEGTESMVTLGQLDDIDLSTCDSGACLNSQRISRKRSLSNDKKLQDDERCSPRKVLKVYTKNDDKSKCDEKETLCPDDHEDKKFKIIVNTNKSEKQDKIIETVEKQVERENREREQLVERVNDFINLSRFENSQCYKIALSTKSVLVSLTKSKNLANTLFLYSHSFSCKRQNCHKLCRMFKNMTLHYKRATHCCAVKYILARLLAIHLDWCTYNNCGLAKCKQMQKERQQCQKTMKMEYQYCRVA